MNAETEENKFKSNLIHVKHVFLGVKTATIKTELPLEQ